MQNTISARQLQRGYKQVLEEANRLNKPLIVISNNKPQGAVIGLDLLEKIQLNQLADEGLKEYRAGKTKTISTDEELAEDLKELEKYV